MGEGTAFIGVCTPVLSLVLSAGIPPLLSGVQTGHTSPGQNREVPLSRTGEGNNLLPGRTGRYPPNRTRGTPSYHTEPDGGARAVYLLRSHGGTFLCLLFSECFVTYENWVSPRGWCKPKPVFYRSFDTAKDLVLMEGTSRAHFNPVVRGKVFVFLNILCCKINLVSNQFKYFVKLYFVTSK